MPPRADAVLRSVRPLAQAFAGAGFSLYLVGGAVRDLLVGGEQPEGHGGLMDLDFSTDARPESIKALLAGPAEAVWTQGERFGTIGALVDGRTVEVTTHRAESYSPDSRKPVVRFGDNIEDDLSRRDFTINAMALEVTGGEPRLLDPFDGLVDLHNRRLRTPLSPEVSFSDDPLRMMRAARFIARFGMVPDEALSRAVGAMSERLSIVSVERIRDELDKLMVTADPSAGLWFLHDSGLAAHFLPELPAMRLEQDPIHRHKDVLAHTIAVVAKTGPRLVVRLAALFHDIGKPRTREVGDQGVSFHHHEVVGAKMTRKRMRALRYSNEMVEDVSRLVYLHLRFHTFRMGWTDSAVRRFVRDAGPQLDQLIELTRCDCTTRNRRRAEELAGRMDRLEERISVLREKEELAAIRPDLDGDRVMEVLGLGPGPVVGRALKFLLEHRLDHGPAEEDEARALLEAWWAEQPESRVAPVAGDATPG